MISKNYKDLLKQHKDQVEDSARFTIGKCGKLIYITAGAVHPHDPERTVKKLKDNSYKNFPFSREPQIEKEKRLFALKLKYPLSPSKFSY